MSSKVLNDYTNSVKKNFAGKKSDRILYTMMLNDVLNDFANEKEDITTEDLYKEFGTPESFAVKLLSNEEYHSLLKKAKKKALIWIIVAVAAIIVSTFCIAMIGHMLGQSGGTITVYNETISIS